MPYTRDLGERYSPLYFLNAFAAGLIAVSFLMFPLWASHTIQSTLPTFHTLQNIITSRGFLEVLVVVAGLAGFLFFAAHHVLLLKWNYLNFKQWRGTAPYKAFQKAADKTVLMAIPLTLLVSLFLLLFTLIMALPAGFGVTSFVVPAAFVGLVVLGWKMMRFFTPYAISLISDTDAPGGHPNNLGRMLTLTTFAGFALSFGLIAMLSSYKILLMLSLLGCVFFMAATTFLALFWLLPQARALLDKTILPETAPLFWMSACVLLPFFLAHLSLNGILSIAFGQMASPGLTVIFIFLALSIFLIFALIGLAWLKKHGLFDQLLKGGLYSAGLYGLLCPATILVITGHVLINAGFCSSGMLTSWGLFYDLLYIPVIVAEVEIVRLFFKIQAKLFSPVVTTTRKPPKSPQ